MESRPTGWWETAFGLWRWRDVERWEARKRWWRRRRVSRRKEEAREGCRFEPLALDQTVQTVIMKKKKQIKVYKLSLGKPQKPT